MSVLHDLIESRDAAQSKYDEFVTAVREAGGALTPEQETERGTLRTAITDLDDRIDEVNEKEKRDAKLAEVRDRIGVKPNDDGTTGAKVTEARTYEEGSPNSYYADLARSSMNGFRGHSEAVERLNRHAYEVAVEVRNGTEEGKRAMAQLRNAHRTENGEDARQLEREVRERGNAGAGSGREVRALSTGTGSGGAFVTPVYLVPDYAPYREAGRAFIDQCHAQILPDYGMSVYVPAVGAAAAVATQGGENTAIATSDPTSGYLQANVNTVAGEVPVSQQLLDRAGPNFSFDVMINDQLMRDLAPKLDAVALAVALAGAGAITYTDASGFTVVARTNPGVGGFYGAVGGAKAAVRSTAGVVQNPTHLFLQPTRWEYISAFSDANGRPIIVPDYAGPFNAAGGGNANGDTGFEGATGYRFNGLPVFQDLNIPAPTTGVDQAIVANLNKLYVWEGAPVPRALPQTNGNNLTVLIQLYEYIAAMALYPLANQAISGSGMSAITF